MEFRVLGPLEVRRASATVVDIGGHRQRRLLAALLLAHGSTVSIDELVDAVWPEDERPAGAERALRTYVSRLRRAFVAAEHGTSSTTQRDEQGCLRTAARGYCLDLDGHQLDSDRLAAAVESCREVESTEADPAAVFGRAEPGLALWRGRPYGDVGEAPWLLAEVRRLDELRLRLVEMHLSARLALGQCAEVVAETEPLCAEHPAREGLWQLRMVALYRDGRQADALRAFQRYREELAERTGLEPGAELVALDRRIALSDPGLLARVADGPKIRAYRLTERLAADADAELWSAVQPSLGRRVVLRRYRAEVANAPEFIRRFEADAEAIGRLEHPHIVPLLDWWREPGAAYLVARWMPGGTLADRLGRGPLSSPQLSRLALHVGAALSYAARAGRRHGALDARHVLADDDGNWFLGGFSLATGEVVAADVDDASAFAGLLAECARAMGTSSSARLAERLTDAATSEDGPGGADLAAVVGLVQEALGGIGDGPPILGSHAARNPYKGLRAFTEADAGDFFGRERLVAQLLAHLARTEGGRTLAVVGPSGSGKSSLVMASLVPALRRGAIGGSSSWFVTTMTPGADPLEALVAALNRVATGLEKGDGPDDGHAAAAADPGADAAPGTGSPADPDDDPTADLIVAAAGAPRAPPGAGGWPSGAELVLVVDQFEELFTVCEDEEVRRRFLRALHRAAGDPAIPVRLILVMRADAWDRALRYPELTELLVEAVVGVGALRPDELEDAVVRPAHVVGCRTEPGLVARIVADVGAQPAGLPMLQYALTELYEQRDGELLTVAAYERLGGVVGALARRADLLLDRAGPAQQQAARQLLRRLVGLSADGDEVRRRVDLTELSGVRTAEDGVDVLALLGDARLVTYDRHPVTREPTVELAHDALLGSWPRLRAWLDEDTDSLRLHRHLGEAALAWEGRGRKPEDLYRGNRLDDAEAWVAGHGAEANELERAFVAAGTADRDAEAVRERARVRRLTRVLAMTVVALAVALVASSIALVQWHRSTQSSDLAARRADEAHAEADRATTATRRADVSRLLAQSHALVAPDRSLALLLAVEADRVEPGAETEEGLADALLDDPHFLGRLPSADHVGTVFVGDGAIVGIEQTTGRTRRWSLDDHTLEHTIADGDGWTPAGVTGAFGLQQSTVDLRAGRIAFGAATSVAVVDAGTGTALGPPIAVPAGFNGWTPVVLGRDGRTVYVGGGTGSTPGRGQGSVTAYDVATGAPTGVSFSGPTARIRKLVLSPDGGRLAAGSYDGTVRVWDTSDGHPLATYAAGALPIGLAWSADGHHLAWSSTVVTPSSLSATSTSVRNLDSGAEELHLDPGSGGAYALDAFTPDGSRLAVLDAIGTLSVYRLGDGSRPESVFAVPSSIGGLAFGPDGDTLVASGDAVTMWSLGAAAGIGRVLPGSSPSLPVPNADGSLLGLGDNDAVRVLDGRTLRPAAGPFPRPDLPQQAQIAKPLAFRADGAQLAIGGAGGTVRLVDLPSGTPALELRDPAIQLAASIAYSPDGSRLAVGGGGGAAVFDTRTGQRIGRAVDLGGNSFAVTVVQFTPEGHLVAAAPVTRRAVVVDPDSGAEQGRFERPYAAAALSPDGRSLAIGTTAGTVELFDTAALTLVGAPIDVYTTTITGLGFGPDSTHLVVVGDRSARLVDVATRTVFHSNFPATAAGGATFSGDGRTVIVPSRAGGAVAWSIDPDVWRERACFLAGRNLTAEEWDRYLPNGGTRRPTCAQWPLA